ncbi:MAG: glycosyltransferase family 2 protein [Acidaminococcaceae bacterium]|nr:glycosyltransferase family 2 protein [Acidaminococcaceae bacterium]
MISVICQVYNQKSEYIRQCIESVLNQTFSDFEFLLLDNGCTDGTSDILREYAGQDARIRLIRFEKNEPRPKWLFALRDYAVGDYVATIDSDDWMEPDYLERLFSLAEEYRVDIVCTGTQMHEEGTGRSPRRKLDQRLILEQRQFPLFFPILQTFFGPPWGKLVRKSVVDRQDLDAQFLYPIHGNDTHINFDWLGACERICMDDSILYHWRIRKKSLFHMYHPEMIEGHAHAYGMMLDFLRSFGPVSLRSKLYADRIYAIRIERDFISSVRDSSLSAEERLLEYRKVAFLPATEQAFQSRAPIVQRCKLALLQAVLECLEGITAESAVLWEVLDKLAEDNIFLNGLRDIEFPRRYGEIYLLIWQDRYKEALEAMQTLMEQEKGCEGAFLDLYLSLASVEKKFPLFISGSKYEMIWKARNLYQQGDREKGRGIVERLENMGFADDPSVLRLKQEKETEPD